MLGIPGTCSLDDEYVLKQALLESGFKDVATESVNVNFAFSSAQDYTRFHQAVTAPVHAMLANETQERKEKIWDTVTAEISTRYAKNRTGSVNLNNESICVSAIK